MCQKYGKNCKDLEFNGEGNSNTELVMPEISSIANSGEDGDAKPVERDDEDSDATNPVETDDEDQEELVKKFASLEPK